MTVTLDPHGQLLAGLKRILQPLIDSGLVPVGGIRAAWPDADMVSKLQTGVFSPLIVISFGPTALSRVQPGQSAASSTAPVTQGQGTVTTLQATMRLETPITFTVAASGERGKTIRAAVASAVIALLGQGISLPLPDSMEQAATAWTPAGTTYGLTAQLVYTGERPDDRLDTRQVYRYDITYRATHSRYAAQTDAVVQGVDIALLSQIGDSAATAATANP